MSLTYAWPINRAVHLTSLYRQQLRAGLFNLILSFCVSMWDACLVLVYGVSQVIMGEFGSKRCRRFLTSNKLYD